MNGSRAIPRSRIRLWRETPVERMRTDRGADSRAYVTRWAYRPEGWNDEPVVLTPWRLIAWFALTGSAVALVIATVLVAISKGSTP